MRMVVVVVAALLTLGLAAFGVVAAQREKAPASSILASLLKPAEPAPRPVAAPSPVSQVAQATISDAPQTTPAEPATPIRVAQNNPPSGPVTPDRFQQNAAPSGPATSVTPANAPAPAAVPAAAQATAAPAHAIPACDKPDALGLSRIVEIDTTGGPAFGTEHFKQYDFLRDHEVVLTFDDGPWPNNTPMVLKALQDNCSKATFFEIGEHATWHPEISKQVAEPG